MIDHETFAQLEEFGIPAGAEVVIYDRIRRKAVFYHKNADRYRFKIMYYISLSTDALKIQYHTR